MRKMANFLVTSELIKQSECECDEGETRLRGETNQRYPTMFAANADGINENKRWTRMRHKTLKRKRDIIFICMNDRDDEDKAHVERMYFCAMLLRDKAKTSRPEAIDRSAVPLPCLSTLQWQIFSKQGSGLKRGRCPGEYRGKLNCAYIHPTVCPSVHPSVCPSPRAVGWTFPLACKWLNDGGWEGPMDRRMDRWMDGWMDGWMNRWMNEWMNE